MEKEVYSTYVFFFHHCLHIRCLAEFPGFSEKLKQWFAEMPEWLGNKAMVNEQFINNSLPAQL